MLLSLSLLVLSASSATASYAGNLNYRSPSHNHPGLGISIPKVVRRSDPRLAFDSSHLNFTHGVASGDPYPNSVVLWTRCAPTFDNVNNSKSTSGLVPLYNPVPIWEDGVSPVSKAPVCLDYRVAKDHEFKHVVVSGVVFTSSDIDYTVKVEASHLRPFTTYYYQFQVCNSYIKSPIGRTKTTPGPRDAIDSLSLAVYSCSNFRTSSIFTQKSPVLTTRVAFGFFNAYGNTVRKDSVDYVLHLG